jgi:hypothetical protein
MSKGIAMIIAAALGLLGNWSGLLTTHVVVTGMILGVCLNATAVLIATAVSGR